MWACFLFLTIKIHFNGANYKKKERKEFFFKIWQQLIAVYFTDLHIANMNKFALNLFKKNHLIDSGSNPIIDRM